MFKLYSFLFFCFAIISFALLKPEKDQKFNGVNLVGTPEVQDSSYCKPLLANNVNSVAIVPFAYGNSETGQLTLQTDWQWWGESFEGSRAFGKLAKDQGFKVMIKPQIWFDWGTYTGDVDLQTDEKWRQFEKGYSKYILTHAQNAADIQADILCIGTELKTFVLKRTDYWNQLIPKIKAIYKGQLTYAGNWDSYKLMPFWNDLDYIGVDAYFPVCEESSPTAETVAAGWQPHISELRSTSETHGKKVIFCEYGYRSTSHCAKTPWETKKGGEINLTAQAQAYEGLYSSVWQEEFMAGGFLWKWYPDHDKAGGAENNRFTPQNKPALDVIRNQYAKEQ
ncbi:MAG: glycoside hydrolase [Flavobacteriales bacterium]